MSSSRRKLGLTKSSRRLTGVLELSGTLVRPSNNDATATCKRHLKSDAASNFITLIPSRLICQMLAIFSAVEF